MNEKIGKMLKFVFPEYQIVEIIEEHGFIANNKRNKEQGNAAQVTPGNITTAGNAQMQTAPNMSSKNQINSNVNELSYSGKTDIDVPTDKLGAKFEVVREEMTSSIVGQTNAIEDLLIAFKRPLITGKKENKPKNTFFIIGPESSGRNTILKKAVNVLKKEELLNYSKISYVNLALYASTSEKELFLSDLYKALYETSDVVLFENFENCHDDMINIIKNLVINGSHKMSERYAVQGGNLTQATGALMQSSVSQIFSNGKYFVFVTKSSESKITEHFGVKFVDRVDDVVNLEAYTQDGIVEVTKNILEDLKRKVKENLSFDLSLSDGLINFCISKHRSSQGFQSIAEFIMNDIYRALSEYRLRSNNVVSNKSIHMDYDGQDIVLVFDEENAFTLTPLMPKRNTGNIEEVKAELAQIIGLASVKEFVVDLENNMKIQKLREDVGNKVSALSRHMIFTGNPGTGKTTIARIVAKYFKAIGLLSTGQLREVTRSDLVGQYVGHTAKQTNEVIQSALGGVLFIDEAYSLCRDKNDTFGLEAVDALVKAVEDYRDDLVVILAGYSDEMQDFLKNNPGLKSRFPNVIDFEDYTADEMVQIAHITAKSKGYVIADDCNEGLMRLFEKSQIKGRNDGGNGRLVRNVIESAILEQSKRITADTSKKDMNILTTNDFDFDNFEQFDLEQRLSQIIGLSSVKKFVRTQHSMLVANEKRRNAGINLDTTQSLNMIFTGNPGTGKTTVGRVVASMFKEMGMLKKGHLVEVDRGGLVAEFAGQTSRKTEEVFRDALGGVLLIDEAYALSENGGGFGKEAIDTLVKLIEDYRGEIVVILAGYKKEMDDFLKTNSGLKSRFPLVIDFPDYTPDELYLIAEKFIDSKGFSLANTAQPVLVEKISMAHKTSDSSSGNGRMVRNIVETIMRNQSARIASVDDISKEALTEIIAGDIKVECLERKEYNLEETFAQIVGLEEVKTYIRSLEARLKIQTKRKKMGLYVDDIQSLHMIFAGNPGTGKTMMARIVADVLHSMGIINTNKLIETDRAGLVAGYVGQTAIKTTEKIMEAMDGVLFIDEAYALSQGGSNDFGREAIDTIVKMMDDNRDRLVVMLAGYSGNMEEFLKSNPGLKSRFPNIIEFPDYSVKDLLQIANDLYSSKGYKLNDDAKDKLKVILEKATTQEAFGNGRYVRNIFERSVNKQSLRLSAGRDLVKEDLVTIISDDIEEV